MVFVRSSLPFLCHYYLCHHYSFVILSEVSFHAVEGNVVEGPAFALCQRLASRLSRYRLGNLFLRRLRSLLRIPPGQPAHHAAQLRADNFDRMLLLFLAKFGKVVAALLVLANPFAGEGAVLNIG